MSNLLEWRPTLEDAKADWPGAVEGDVISKAAGGGYCIGGHHIVPNTVWVFRAGQWVENPPPPSLLDAAKAALNKLRNFDDSVPIYETCMALEDAIRTEEAREEKAKLDYIAYMKDDARGRGYDDVQQKLIQSYTDQTSRLRAENAELRAGLEEMVDNCIAAADVHGHGYRVDMTVSEFNAHEEAVNNARAILAKANGETT